ncbi:MAG: twin-arginine translocase subunit TatB, partial [Alphaproteobacteria bacterium]|nr:twin-arginine translocase subunit TatB [Alphaproteobacteria bacterium]
MFDFSSWELVVIGAVALVVLGPKELPNAVRAVTGFARKARELAHDFQSGLEEIAR